MLTTLSPTEVVRRVRAWAPAASRHVAGCVCGRARPSAAPEMGVAAMCRLRSGPLRPPAATTYAAARASAPPCSAAHGDVVRMRVCASTSDFDGAPAHHRVGYQYRQQQQHQLHQQQQQYSTSGSSGIYTSSSSSSIGIVAAASS